MPGSRQVDDGGVERIRRKAPKQSHVRSKTFRTAMARGDYSERMARTDPTIRIVALAALHEAAAREYAEINGTPYEAPATVVARQGAPGQAFLDRIAVNHVRHRLSDYDELLRKVSESKHGGLTVLNLLRRKTYQAIMKAYPSLTAECVAQIAQRERVQLAREAAKPKADASAGTSRKAGKEGREKARGNNGSGKHAQTSR